MSGSDPNQPYLRFAKNRAVLNGKTTSWMNRNGVHVKSEPFEGPDNTKGNLIPNWEEFRKVSRDLQDGVLGFKEQDNKPKE